SAASAGGGEKILHGAGELGGRFHLDDARGASNGVRGLGQRLELFAGSFRRQQAVVHQQGVAAHLLAEQVEHAVVVAEERFAWNRDGGALAGRGRRRGGRRRARPAVSLRERDKRPGQLVDRTGVSRVPVGTGRVRDGAQFAEDVR